ncbi:transmembrane protein 127-like [Branchiostoma floridae]|uniref:Transmembrane protein 127-like n=2 Tax=Branchiostoma floridae TaxID=7739 RepID=A0A9J7M329_BRAFL|nr:transmembrane protein 127-like [Branchiostoma floridae]
MSSPEAASPSTPSDAPAVSPAVAAVRRRWRRPKRRERNVAGAAFSVVVIAALSTALAEPRWFHVHGGKCQHTNEYIGINLFLRDSTVKPLLDSYCVTEHAVLILRVVVTLSMVAIVTSLAAFIIDILGSMRRSWRILRRNGVANILTVLLCVTVNGLCYWASTMMYALQHSHRIYTGSKVYVAFDVGYYLVAGAGSAAVLAVACGLLRRYPPEDDDQSDGLMLMDNDELDFWRGVEYAAMMERQQAPPPAYAP